MTFWFLEYTVHLIIYQQGIYPAEKKLQHSLDIQVTITID